MCKIVLQIISQGFVKLLLMKSCLILSIELIRSALLIILVSLHRGCARFAEILQNCEACQVFRRMCLIFFLAFTLKLSRQTLLSVTPIQSVFWRATQFQQNEYTPGPFTLSEREWLILSSCPPRFYPLHYPTPRPFTKADKDALHRIIRC